MPSHRGSYVLQTESLHTHIWQGLYTPLSVAAPDPLLLCLCPCRTPMLLQPESPFWYAHLPSEEAARAVAARSVLAKAFIEVWGEGETFEELQQSVAAYPADEREKWTGPEQSFKFVVEAWGATYTMKQQIDLIDRMEGCTNFKGPIDLSNPQNRFWLIIVKSNGRGLPLLADRYYFGREVGVADRSVMFRCLPPQ